MIRTLSMATALGIAALAAAGQAQAALVTLPDFFGTTECTTNSADVGGNPCQLPGAQAFYAPAPFAAVQAMVSGAPGEGNHAAAASLTYFYTIDGPDNGPIAIDIETDLVTAASLGATSGFASLVDTEDHQLCAQTGQGGCGDIAHLNGSLVEMETPGLVYSIHLEVVE